MTDRLKNKVALITGAGTRGEITGIGQASSILMAREGAKILINDINADRAKSTLSQIENEGGEGLVIAEDCTKIVELLTFFFGEMSESCKISEQ